MNANVSVMGALTASLGAVSVISLDAPGAARRATHFDPFEPLGLWHAGAFCHALAKRLVEALDTDPTDIAVQLDLTLALLANGKLEAG